MTVPELRVTQLCKWLWLEETSCVMNRTKNSAFLISRELAALVLFSLVPEMIRNCRDGQQSQGQKAFRAPDVTVLPAQEFVLCRAAPHRALLAPLCSAFLILRSLASALMLWRVTLLCLHPQSDHSLRSIWLLCSQKVTIFLGKPSTRTLFSTFWMRSWNISCVIREGLTPGR